MQIPLPQKRNGMYLFSRRDFDLVAELVLQEYAPYALEKAQSLRVEALADEAYSLTILDRYLSASGKILGMINFDDIKVTVGGLDKRVRQEHLMSGTILVDAGLLSECHHRRRRFTIAHELAHWIIHRQMFYADGPCCNLRQARRHLVCREIGFSQKAGNIIWSDSDWLEWQADLLDSAMLMAAHIFYPFARTIMERYRIGAYMLENCGKKVSDVISELCDTFDVSRTAVRIRLKEQKLLRSPNITGPRFG